MKYEAPTQLHPTGLTKVFGGGAILSMDNNQPWPQDLQGGHVGRKDAKGSCLRGHIHLPDVGTVEKHLEKHRECVTAGQSSSARDGLPCRATAKGGREHCCGTRRRSRWGGDFSFGAPQHLSAGI